MRSTRVPRWLFDLGLFVAVAAATHLLTIWALPRVIMQRAMASVAGERPPAPMLSARTDHLQRRIVMPSPDLLYAVCVWDVSKRPLHIRAELSSLHYGSVALYAANSDNFFVVNDRELGGAALDLVLAGPQADGATAALPPGARLVEAPSPRGLLLMRVLVGDPAADATVAEAARRSLRCETL